MVVARAITLACSVTGVLLGASPSRAAAGDPRADFKITTKRETDNVVVVREPERVIFSINSPFGISQAVIERAGDKWPHEVVLRLHLAGLSHFRITNGRVVLEAAASSDNDAQRVRLWKDGQEDSPLTARSDLWMDIRMMGDDGKPAKHIPLRHGYFEIPLPRALFADNPQTITINWIDFYRG